MAPAKIPTVTISQVKHIHYWRNAEECFEGMKDAARARRWHLTSLNGVHCVIAAADALLVHTAGLRCKGKNHLDVFVLLKQHVGDPDVNQMLKHGISVVRRKTDIEYRAKRISEAEAHQLIKQVERFYEWVRSKIS
jgi:HEPN domain-containing protein